MGISILATGTHIDRKKAKEKYQGMFQIQKSGDKTISGEIERKLYSPSVKCIL